MQITKLSYTILGFAGNINSASNSKREVVQLLPYEGRNYNNTHFITTDYGNDGQTTRIAMRRRDLNDDVIEYLPDGGKKIIMGEMLDNVPLRDEVKFLFEPTSVKYAVTILMN